MRCLFSELANTTSLLDLLLGQLGEGSGTNNNSLLWKITLTEDLEDTSLGAIDDWRLLRLGISLTGLLSNEGPHLLNIDGRAMVGVSSEMEMSHTNLTEVTWMVLVKVDSVVMLTSGLTTPTWMLTVLSNTTMSHTDMSSKASSLLKS